MMSDEDLVEEALSEARAIVTGYLDWDADDLVPFFTDAIAAFKRLREGDAFTEALAAYIHLKEVSDLREENERLREAYRRLLLRLKAATPQSLWSLTEKEMP
jgi:hypothetical protein